MGSEQRTPSDNSATTGGDESSRPAPRETKRGHAIRKEQNRKAARTYRKRRRQKLSLLEQLLEKGKNHAGAGPSYRDPSTGAASSDQEDAHAIPSLTSSVHLAGPAPEQTASPGPGSGVMGEAAPSTFEGLSFDSPWPWPMSNNDAVLNLALPRASDFSGAASNPGSFGPTSSPSFVLGQYARDSSKTSAFQGPGPVPGPLTSPREDTSGEVDSTVKSSSSALTLSSALSSYWQVPRDDSLGSFIDHLMSLRVPVVRNVIYVQQSGMFAAVMDNALALGVMNGLSLFEDDANSPFIKDWMESKGSVQVSQIKTKFSATPKDLQPVDVQITVEHHVYLDVIPFPSFREKALRALARDPPLFDEYELCDDICNHQGLVVWGSQENRQGMEACRPWDMRSWEPKPWFLRKYSFLVGGWEDEMWKAARWWHSVRNERIRIEPADVPASA